MIVNVQRSLNDHIDNTRNQEHEEVAKIENKFWIKKLATQKLRKLRKKETISNRVICFFQP